MNINVTKYIFRIKNKYFEVNKVFKNNFQVNVDDNVFKSEIRLKIKLLLRLKFKKQTKIKMLQTFFKKYLKN